jgi:hypothetical protein
MFAARIYPPGVGSPASAGGADSPVDGVPGAAGAQAASTSTSIIPTNKYRLFMIYLPF